MEPQRWRALYGDFEMGAEDAGADDVAGGAIMGWRGGGGGARVVWQQGTEADLGLAGCRQERVLWRPALDQRDRSAQRRMQLPSRPSRMGCRRRGCRSEARDSPTNHVKL